MITEDYVSFETAKLLKEKGFDLSEFYGKWAIDYDNIPHDENNTEGEIIIAEWHYPLITLQIAMKWLRKDHHLEIYPFHDAIQECNTWWYRIEKHIKGCCLTEHESDSIYNEYEEACEAAIKYCLENLI